MPLDSLWVLVSSTRMTSGAFATLVRDGAKAPPHHEASISTSCLKEKAKPSSRRVEGLPQHLLIDLEPIAGSGTVMLPLRHEGAHERLLARLGSVGLAEETDRRLRVHVGEGALNALVRVGVVGAAPCFPPWAFSCGER